MDIVNTIKSTKIQPTNKNATFQKQTIKKIEQSTIKNTTVQKQIIEQPTNKTIKSTVNTLEPITKKRIASPAITITLPLSPITRIVNHQKETVIESNIIVHQDAVEVKGSVLDIVNFIDVEKIIDAKKSKNTNVYELKNLKNFAKTIEINFNNIKKNILIQNIKSKIDDYLHGDNNLVYDIKHLNKKLSNEKLYDQIDILFDKHHISENKKSTLLPLIKTQLKASDVNKLDHVIHILEKEWM